MLNKISVAIIIHLMFGIYTYGSLSIFPNEIGVFVFDTFVEQPLLNISSSSLLYEIGRRVISLFKNH